MRNLAKVTTITVVISLFTLVLFFLGVLGYRSLFADAVTPAAYYPFDFEDAIHLDTSEGAWIDEVWQASQFFVTELDDQGDADPYNDTLRYRRHDDVSLDTITPGSIEITSPADLEFETEKLPIPCDCVPGPPCVCPTADHTHKHNHKYAISGIHVPGDAVVTAWSVSGHVHFSSL